MKIHFIAIGGTGMGATAGLMTEAGHDVRGSDGPLYPPMSDLLRNLAIDVAEGYDARNLDWNPDLVVLGNTCKADHPEYEAAQARGLRIVSFPQLLAETLLQDRQSIVIAGTHGKTTTTSLTAFLLEKTGLNPGYLIGGIPLDLGRSFAVGHAPHFVIEGDEYHSACFDRVPKFTHYRPHVAVLTGIEFDHADIYPNLAAIEAAFVKLIDGVADGGRLLVNAQCPSSMKLAQRRRSIFCGYEVHSAETALTVRPGMDWVGVYRPLDQGRQELTVSYRNEHRFTLEVNLSGSHNMANVLAAAAVGAHLGLSPQAITAALAQFSGVKRRQEVVGEAKGVVVIDDFAHHPTAVEETIKGLKAIQKRGRLVAVFEPRSSTSRRNVFQRHYAEALRFADRVCIAPLFAVDKIPPGERLDLDRLVRDLRDSGTEADHYRSVTEIIETLTTECQAGDTVLTMSSGGFEGIHQRLLAAIATRT